MSPENIYPRPENTPPLPAFEPTVHLSRWQRIGQRTMQLVGRGRRYQNPEVDGSPSEFAADVQSESIVPVILEHPYDSSETITVSLITNANDIRFYAADGTEVGRPDYYSSKTAAHNAFTILARAFLEVDHAAATPHTIAQHTGKRSMDIVRTFRRIEDCAPDDSISYRASEGVILFGNIAVASRVAPPDELKIYRQQRAEHTAAKAEERRKVLELQLRIPSAETPATEPETMGILDADHAHIEVKTTVGERIFVIPLEDERAIIAAQCLEIIGGLPDKAFSHRDIVTAIIGRMSDDERQSLQEEGRELSIAESVLDTLRTLTNKMCITHEPYDRQFKRLTDTFSVAYVDTQPTADTLNNPKTATVFPPGTSKRDITEYGQTTEPDDTTRQLAAKLVAMVKIVHTTPEERPEISHEEAVEYLDFVMSYAGKQAIGTELRTKYGSNRLSRTTRSIRRKIIRPALGSGYSSAVRNRTIAGNHATGDKRITQVSGALPTTTKWHVGMGLHNEEPSLGKDTTHP